RRGVGHMASQDGRREVQYRRRGGTAGRGRDRLPARRFCVVDVAQSLRPRDQRGRHQLHAADQMVRRCADARLYQTDAEKPLSERGGGARWAYPDLICGYLSLFAGTRLGRLAHGGDQRARLALSFPLGLIGALMRVSDNRFASTVATVYVEIVRNIPLLVVL